MNKHAHPHNSTQVQGSRPRPVEAGNVAAVEVTLPGSPADLICECGVFVGLLPDGDYAPVPCPQHPIPATAAALAQGCTRRVDELAGTVEHCVAQLRAVSEALGDLQVELDRIRHTERGGRS